MRKFIAVLVFMLASAPALAFQGFESNFQGEPDASIGVGRIDFSTAMVYKAESLGQQELRRLASYLRENLDEALTRSNWHGMSTQENVLNVTIVDAAPNRPTLHQINNLEGAHYSDQFPGGASLTATLVDGDGMVIATFSYAWFNDALDEDASYGIWTDTRLTFDRFANSVADSLGQAPQPGS